MYLCWNRFVHLKCIQYLNKKTIILDQIDYKVNLFSLILNKRILSMHFKTMFICEVQGFSLHFKLVFAHWISIRKSTFNKSSKHHCNQINGIWDHTGQTNIEYFNEK